MTGGFTGSPVQIPRGEISVIDCASSATLPSDRMDIVNRCWPGGADCPHYGFFNWGQQSFDAD
jgi:hypothetical protein